VITITNDCRVTSRSILPYLDRFQIMKRGRLNYLLDELKVFEEIPVYRWLSHVAVTYGIRRTTAKEYLEDLVDGGYITIEREIIKFVKDIEKPVIKATRQMKEESIAI
jgi:DNA-binding transcriptional regulator YhcF (GntR family)